MSFKEKPDFGTYHHSTASESVKIRKNIRGRFRKAFASIPFSRDDKIKILDVGCGLGFLSWVCAEYYPKAKVIGFDTFEHASLKDSNLQKAKRNAKVLGFSERIKFRKGDLFDSNFGRGKFDLIVANLVFHNFGKKRFGAYKRVVQWSTPNTYIVLGDVFFDYKKDLRNLSNLFGNVKKMPNLAIGTRYKMLALSEPKK